APVPATSEAGEGRAVWADPAAAPVGPNRTDGDGRAWLLLPIVTRLSPDCLRAATCSREPARPFLIDSHADPQTSRRLNTRPGSRAASSTCAESCAHLDFNMGAAPAGAQSELPRRPEQRSQDHRGQAADQADHPRGNGTAHA